MKNLTFKMIQFLTMQDMTTFCLNFKKKNSPLDNLKLCKLVHTVKRNKVKDKVSHQVIDMEGMEQVFWLQQICELLQKILVKINRVVQEESLLVKEWVLTIINIVKILFCSLVMILYVYSSNSSSSSLNISLGKMITTTIWLLLRTNLNFLV